MSKLMQSILALLLFAGVLAGCGEKPMVDGKDVNYWAQKAKELQNVPQPPAVQMPMPKQVTAEEAAKRARLEEEKRVRLNKDYNDEYLAKVRERVNEIQSSKDGKVLFGATQYTLESADMYEGPAGVVLGGMWQYHEAFTRGLLQMDVASKTDQTTSAETDLSTRTQIRAAVIGWFVSDQKRLNVLWSTVRPMLRLKYGLLMTLRRHEQLFKTSYTGKTFEPLQECLFWSEEHVRTVRNNREGPPIPDHSEAGRCNGVFTKFGVKAEFGLTGDAQKELTARNALWIVRFLARRSADGQDKFAQQFQRLALDYIEQ